MSFEEYVNISIQDDREFQDAIENEIGKHNGDFGWTRLDAEVEIVKFDQSSKVIEIIANFIVESRKMDGDHYLKARFSAQFEGRGDKSAKFTLINLLELSDEDGHY